MSDVDDQPSNPYADEAATAPRLADRAGYPSAAPRKPAVNLSDEAQLGRETCAACGRSILPGGAYSDRRGGPWHRLCIPPFLDIKPAVAPSCSPPQTMPIVVVRGHIKWVDPVKGYGFIVPDPPGADVFLLCATLKSSGYKMWVPGAGAGIEVEAVDRGRGLVATRVRWLEWTGEGEHG